MPSLTRRDVESPASGLILMLHGGREDSTEPVKSWNSSWRRSAWMMYSITRGAHQAGVGIWLLRHQQRGWNAGAAALPSPVPDARWALDEVRRELGSVPVVLLGHSMGARTAVAVAGDASVRGVVALAPWLPASDPVHPLAGRHLATAHGRTDEITSFEATEEFVRRAGRVTASTEMVDMGRVGHYMLRSIPAWNDFALTRALSFVAEQDRRG